MLAQKGVPLLLGVAVVLIFFIGLDDSFPERTDRVAQGWTIDDEKRKIYGRYVFSGPDEAVIDAGYQPLAVPTGTVPAVMMRDGILARELGKIGKSVKFHPFFEGGDINSFLFSRHLEVMWAGDMPVIKAAARFPVIVTAQVKTAFAAIITRNLYSMDRLKGRRVGYVPGSSAHQVLLNGLALQGMTDKDVSLVEIPVNRMIGALREGMVDAIAVWEPTITLAREQLKDHAVPYRALTQSFLYFSKDFFDKHFEAARLLTAATLRAVRWMSRSRENARKACQWHRALAEAFSRGTEFLSEDQCLSILHRDLLDPLPMAMIPPESLHAEGAMSRKFLFLQQIGILDRTMDFKQVRSAFRTDLLEEMIMDKERWRIMEFDDR
ncbi:MAG: ABC transporter substrate-binding protein [Magnetococcales bacterium]|nr:ABC transporter substrate-binding protein [Magnetococcales bacterium]